MITLRCMMLVPLMWLFSCNEERTSREEMRIQKEVSQRVDAIRSEMKVSENRWHTIRTVAFCLLAGGSLIWLLNDAGGKEGDHPRPADGGYPRSQTRRRVIDRPYDDEDESESHPHRR